MEPRVILCLTALTVTALAYGAREARYRRRARVRRRYEARLTALGVDPYYAAAVRGEETRAAAAELLLAGAIGIDSRYVVRLADGAGTQAPAHPVPAALLEAVRRRHPRPVVLGRIIQRDPVYEERCGAFRRARAESLPRPPRTGGAHGALFGCAGVLAVAALCGFWGFAMAAVTSRLPHGAVEWAAALGTVLALVLLVWGPGGDRKRDPEPAENDLLRAYCLLLPHPALVALDAERLRRVERSVWLGRRTRKRPGAV
ncbi:hypothetical protein [Streptomyces sp. NPDC059564]|uniref:hypothetical protein n=1 Tax=Streptomyces sp. NPDC059564 TaxID=3346865 RepID=UPI00368210A7